MESKSAILLDLVLCFGISNDRAFVLPDGGHTDIRFDSYVDMYVPPCLAVWRVDKNRSAFQSENGKILMAYVALVVSRDGRMVELYFLE